MAKIFIQPDADGDLHTAALHNDKFQSVLNEINGNIDETNLKYPNSIFTLHSSASISDAGFKGSGGAPSEAQRYPVGWLNITSAPLYAWGWTPLSSIKHVVVNSFHKTDRALKVEKVVYGIMRSTHLTAGQTWTLSVETADSQAPTATWTAVSSKTTELNLGSGVDVLVYSENPSSSAIPTNNYLRVCLTTPSGAFGEFIGGFDDGSGRGCPPPYWCQIICSTQHVA
jgi:hypothetical protein